jgi:hypothetical protein
MTLRVHIAVALTFAALGLVPGAAHLMELPVKLTYSPELYAEVTSTLYAWYGIAGGAAQVGAAFIVALLAARVRHSSSAGLALATAATFIISLVLWGAVVSPVNSAWAEVSRASPGELASAYARLRGRWEFGHLAAFIAWFTGWLGLVALATRWPVVDPKSAA